MINKRRSDWNFHINCTTSELQDKEETQISYEATGQMRLCSLEAEKSKINVRNWMHPCSYFVHQAVKTTVQL